MAEEKNNVDTALVEKYQLILQKDPQSLVFAPLVDAYRKLGMLNEAVELGLDGVNFHPNFASGRIALARVLIDRVQFEEASEQLQESVKLAPENIMAFHLLGDCLVRLKKPKKALKAYKMVLFLNPNHERAISSVRKLESITADEFDDEMFQMLPLNPLKKDEDLVLVPIDDGEAPSPSHLQTQLNRSLSLIDAFIVRNEFQKAYSVLEQAEPYHSEEPEIVKRRKILKQIFSSDDEFETPSSKSSPLPAREKERRQQKIQRLNHFLNRLEKIAADRDASL